MPYYKIVILGDVRVGKTALAMSYVYGRAPVKYNPTSEDVYTKTIEGPTSKGKGTVFLHFWDTSGKICALDELKKRQRYYLFADAIMIVFNADKEESVEKIDLLKSEVSELTGRKPPIFVVQSSLPSNEENINKADTNCDFNLKSLHKDDIEQCFSQMLQHCQINAGGYSSSIKRAPSKTNVNSTIKNKVLLKS